jgi:hypothetical protein
MRHQWNTGRPYTDHGQRIVAETVEGGVIFNDIDRGVDGFIPMVRVPYGTWDVREVVMFNYDRTNYQYDPENRSRDLAWDE